VLVLAVALGLVTLLIQIYDSAARESSYRVSDLYAEAIIKNQQPSPSPSNEAPSLVKKVGSLFPPQNADLLDARQARTLRDTLEAFIGILQLFAALLQIGVVLASAAILNRRF